MTNISIPALKINQWLVEWDKVNFKGRKIKKPQPHFYFFTIEAQLLKRLSKVYPRTTKEREPEDSGVQRRHDPERSLEIREYVSGGFPWSELSKKKRESVEFEDLRMPGWLPTAIIANIITSDSKRLKNIKKIPELIKVHENRRDSFSELILPKNVAAQNWKPDIPLIEIIDGQHRLWAFELEEKLNGKFELPVVAFYGLDIVWQAYLFYIINIKPKKINASLAYDLYPILRVQDWLEKSPEGAFIYRETRAQELTEILWSHEKSPWKDRINLLGETRSIASVTQAAFIRSLTSTFIKTAAGPGVKIGGLFGSIINEDSLLNWNRIQQAAFLIIIWNEIANAMKSSNSDWLKTLRNNYNNGEENELMDYDAGFSSKYSLLSTDQGVRGYLHIINDMLYVEYERFSLNKIQWSDEIKEDRIDNNDVTKAIKQFERASFINYIKGITKELTKFDWRTSSEPTLDQKQRQKQMIFKGSSGYKELRQELLKVLVNSKISEIKNAAKKILNLLGYDSN